MAKYRVTAHINLEDVLELDEKDFENEEEMNEEICLDLDERNLEIAHEKYVV